MFCLQAPALLDRLLASGRVQRLLSSPLPSPPPLQRGARRLSRSESDLYCFTGKEKALGSPRQHHNFMRHKAVLERSHSSSRTSATSDDYVQAMGGKVRMVSDLWRRAALPCNVLPKRRPRLSLYALTRVFQNYNTAFIYLLFIGRRYQYIKTMQQPKLD